MYKRTFTLFTLVVLVLVAVAAPALTQENGSTTVVGGSEEQLRTLLARMMTGYGPYQSDTVVTVAGLPANIEYNIPVPDGANIIGSMRMVEFYGGVSYQIIMDTALSGPDAADFFTANLGEGWTRAEDQMPAPGGFVDTSFYGANYCYNGSDATMNLNATTVDSMTEVRLYVRTPGDSYLCGGQPYQPPFEDPYFLLPALRAPSGVRILPGGGGGGGGPVLSAGSSSVLESGLSMAELNAAFTVQLEAAGWTQTASFVNDSSAWSLWSFTSESGKQWGGSFNIVPEPTSGQFYATVRVVEQP